MSTPRGRDAGALALLLLACFAVAALGGLSTTASVREWYPTLVRPWFTPPDFLFGPVWTVLYVAMAVAAWLVWRRREEARVGPALGAWWLQLALNCAWSPVFFGARQLGWGLAVILALDAALAATVVAFFRVRRAAGWLLVPYLAWVLFATLLNGALWRLNS